MVARSMTPQSLLSSPRRAEGPLRLTARDTRTILAVAMRDEHRKWRILPVLGLLIGLAALWPSRGSAHASPR